jgi:membrane-bound lytic murein transglycosylase B
MGFDIGEPDGMVGAKTRDAVQDYQLSRGLPADGYPTVDLIARIDQEKTIPAVRIAPARQ